MNIFWFRRDLRIDDNHALLAALEMGKTLPVFIFDTNILDDLPKDDARVNYIYDTLKKIDDTLIKYSSGIRVFYGKPLDIFNELIRNEKPKAIFLNRDYEPYATKRDAEIEQLARENNVDFHSFKDQVIFEKDEVVKSDGRPFQVFTPYKNKWLSRFSDITHYHSESKLDNLIRFENRFPEMEEMGFKTNIRPIRNFSFNGLDEYEKYRDYPALDRTSYSSLHLRFGTLSVRKAIEAAMKINNTLLSEFIWREFFMQVLYHFPEVVNESFNPRFRGIEWLNDKDAFEKWKNGSTGFPLVDAGMRQLNESGYMHNRVRMVTAGFLTKHLLIDWRWGERYFAEKLLDYDLAANNGNWQWAAGTGCDAAPYFRVFNPVTQQEKFDKNHEYIRRWIPEFGSSAYPAPMIDHKYARERAIKAFQGLQ